MLWEPYVSPIPRWQRCSTITTLRSVGSITLLALVHPGRRRIGSVKSACLTVRTRIAPDRSGQNNVDLNPADVLTDIGACKLPNMTWVIPTGQNSDHPVKIASTGGPSWVASIVNAIGQSPCKNPDGSSYWNSTAIFITWDDWGGWYDHEPPTLLSLPNAGQGDYQYGFRVPLLVVSAYTPLGYINNGRHDFGSILRFVEHNFGIPEGALNFADARATNRSHRLF